jgi:hypothetical protein
MEFSPLYGSRVRGVKVRKTMAGSSRGSVAGGDGRKRKV